MLIKKKNCNLFLSIIFNKFLTFELVLTKILFYSTLIFMTPVTSASVFSFYPQYFYIFFKFNLYTDRRNVAITVCNAQRNYECFSATLLRFLSITQATSRAFIQRFQVPIPFRHDIFHFGTNHSIKFIVCSSLISKTAGHKKIRFLCWYKISHITFCLFVFVISFQII